MSTPTGRIEQIADFVKDRLFRVAAEQEGQLYDPRYRWQHTLRVCNYGKLIAEAEGANVELVVAACLLHDLAVFDPGKPRDHGRKAAEICRPFLKSLGYSEADIENICYSVASHVDEPNPKTIEAKIVTDADNIDRFGAYRAFLWCLRNMDDYNMLVVDLTTRLEKLREFRAKDVMETEMGNTLFNDHLDFQINFFDRIVKESDWTLLPRL